MLQYKALQWAFKIVLVKVISHEPSQSAIVNHNTTNFDLKLKEFLNADKKIRVGYMQRQTEYTASLLSKSKDTPC